jgi:hypothetical protein
MNRNRNRSLLALAVATAVLVAAALAAFAGQGSASAQQAPGNRTPPTIAGTPQRGSTLTAIEGTWTGRAPITFAYQWLRCGPNGQNCAAIIGATGKTYLLRQADVGRTIRVRVTATNSQGSASAQSAATARIVAGLAPSRGCDAAAPLQIANIAPPERLVVSQGTITPSVVRRSTRTLVVRVQVTCKNKPVQGALVYGTAVPFNQFTAPTEQPTGADGFAQLTMTQLSGFPAARRQQLLVIFLRARKTGENLLGGISTRRLVSFPVDLRS